MGDAHVALGWRVHSWWATVVATRAGLPVQTLPATKAILDRASELLGVPVGPVLATLGKSVGPPWQKEHREATAAALVARAATH